MNNRGMGRKWDYEYFGRSQDDIEDNFCGYPFLAKGSIADGYPNTYRALEIREQKKSYKERDDFWAVHRSMEKPGAQSRDSMAHCHDSEREWAMVGYAVMLGLVVALVGSVVRFFVPDWWLLLIAAGGMLLVVIALWRGQKLAQQ